MGSMGKENDNEVKGEGNQQDYGMRVYDPRIGKFLSVDPITAHYPMLTPYQFASNRPIDGVDLDGLEYAPPMKFNKSGKAVVDVKAATELYTSPANAQALAFGAVFALDLYATGGWFTTSLFAASVVSHTPAKTPEGREAQRSNGREALTNLFLGWAAGKIVSEGGEFIQFIKRGSPIVNEASSINIALGKNMGMSPADNINLKAFAQETGSISFHDFNSIPGYKALSGTESFYNFEDAFQYAAEAAINTKGKILFNLNGVNLNRVANIKPGTGLYEELGEFGNKSLWEMGNITEWELSRILNNKEWLKSTEFYLNGSKQSTTEVLNSIKPN